MRILLLFATFASCVLNANPAARIEDTLIDSEMLDLVTINPNLSDQEAATLKKENARILIGYLESYFMERYCEETFNQVTMDEVEQEIDDLLNQAYQEFGPNGSVTEKYNKHTQQIALLADLLTIYERNPQEAEIAYLKKYTEMLTPTQWDQIKRNYSKSSLEAAKRVINAPIPTEAEIRAQYRHRAYSQVLNKKFMDELGREKIKYSNWVKERFPKVQILNADYFDLEILSHYFIKIKPDIKPQEIQRKSSTKTVSEPIQRIEKGIDPEVVREDEEVIRPETLIRKITEKLPVEPSNKFVEKPSSWWFWLIGLLVLIVGFGVLRPKK